MSIYTIKQGRHYSTHWVGMVWRAITGWQLSNCRQARVCFPAKCLIPSQDPTDINKLFGLGFGLDHHENSVRFGWRAAGKRIALFAYEYKDGKRFHTFLKYLLPEQEYFLGIYLFGGHKAGYVVRNRQGLVLVDEETRVHNLPTFKSRLYPYFGGTYPAPVDMKIKIEWL